MDKDDFKKEVEKLLPKGLHKKSGAVLYSDFKTLKQSDVYLLGFNPNGEPDDKNPDEWIINNVCCDDDENAYIDQCWVPDCEAVSPKQCQQILCKAGHRPMQKRVCWLLETLKLEPRDVCASNLIFKRASRKDKFYTINKKFALANRCWPVHERILKIVQPKLIITLGYSESAPAYPYLLAKFSSRKNQTTRLPKPDQRVLQGFPCRIGDKECYVAGFPHLSWYNPEAHKDTITDWLSPKLGESTSQRRNNKLVIAQTEGININRPPMHPVKRGEMDKDEFKKEVEKLLPEYLHGEDGRILYSGCKTLRPGPVYLLGFKPAEDEESGKTVGTRRIIDHVCYGGYKNAYLDEYWNGENPLQKNVCWLLKTLKLEPRGVCASNLIFIRSKEQGEVKCPEDADKCWYVHEFILQRVQPKLIIAFGNSNNNDNDTPAYSYLRKKFEEEESFEGSPDEDTYHDKFKLKGFSCQINGKTCYVAGLPNLRRYHPEDDKDAIENWLLPKLYWRK